MARLICSLLNYRPGRIGGAETFLRNLMGRLPERLQGHEVIMLLPADVEIAVGQYGQRLHVNETVKKLTQWRVLESLTPWRASKIEQQIANLKPDMIYYPQQSVFPIRHPAGVKSLMTLFDIQHLTHPQYVPIVERLFRWGIYGRSLKTVDEVVCISEYAKATLLSHEQGLDEARVKVVSLGYQQSQPAHAPFPNEYQKYVFYPAATFPHKNHQQLFDAVGELVAKGRWEYQVVLTGMQTGHWSKLVRQIRNLGLEQMVVHEGFVSMERVQQLYEHAEAVVFPSLHEGFGLPVIEASRWGKKIIASRLPVYEELGLPAHAMIDYLKAEELACAMSSQQTWELTRQPSTWEDVADQYAEIILEILQADQTESV